MSAQKDAVQKHRTTILPQLSDPRSTFQAQTSWCHQSKWCFAEQSGTKVTRLIILRLLKVIESYKCGTRNHFMWEFQQKYYQIAGVTRDFGCCNVEQNTNDWRNSTVQAGSVEGIGRTAFRVLNQAYQFPPWILPDLLKPPTFVFWSN